MENTPTYLSDNVYEVIINLRFTYSCGTAVIDENLLFDWNKIDSELKHISECDCILDESCEWYRDKIKVLWGIMRSADDKFRISSNSEKDKLIALSSWVFNPSEIVDIYNKFKTNEESELLFCVLKLTSYLDRALGDIYKSSCDHVPFLLKDMLASNILSDVIGKTQTKFLQLLFGSVKGINLRNVAWHGFFSPGELHHSIVPALFLIIASLGASLKNFERRPTIKCETLKNHSQYLEPFFFGITFDNAKFMDIIMICPFISNRHWGYWKYASDLYIKGCFGDSLIFLMPLKENLLRSIFCHANDCSQRILTAEVTSFYMTMDEILAQNVGTSDNRLQHVIGLKMLEMLLDLYIYMEGPRIRDRISHSEIKPYDVSEGITRCIFDISLLLIILITINVKKELTEHERLLLSSEYSSKLISLTLKYEPQFHPMCILLRSLINVIYKVASWNKLPTPSELAHLITNAHEKFINLFEIATGHKDFVNYSSDLVKRIKSLKPATIYRPKHELEMVSMLRKIVSSLETVNDNIVESCETKRLRWKNKQMKSRNRENYKAMIDCISCLQLGIGCICHIMYITLKELQNNEIEEVKSVQRFFRRCQKYTENASSMSAIKKNRWTELKDSTLNICNMIVTETLFRTK